LKIITNWRVKRGDSTPNPEYVPFSDPREQQYPLMMNPNNPDVQEV